MTGRTIVCVSVLLLGGACAPLGASSSAVVKDPAPSATSSGAKAGPSEESMLVCEMEEPLGSHIRRKVCRKRELTEADRRAVEEIMNKSIQKCQKAPCTD